MERANVYWLYNIAIYIINYLEIFILLFSLLPFIIINIYTPPCSPHIAAKYKTFTKNQHGTCNVEIIIKGFQLITIMS